MAKEPGFSVLPELFGNNHGIVINGKVYLVDASGSDGSLEYRSKRYPLTYHGSMEKMQSIDELAKAREIEMFKREALHDALGNFMPVKTDFDLHLMFQCITDILPELDEFDGRVNDFPRSYLVRLRKKEILDKMPVVENIEEFSRKKAEDSIYDYFQDMMEKKWAQCADNDIWTTKVDFEQSFIFMDKKFVIFPSEEKGADMIFRKNGNACHYITEKKLPGGFIRIPLSAMKVVQFLDECQMNLDNNLLDSFGRYCADQKTKFEKDELVSESFTYQRSGVRLVGDERKNKLFIYTIPVPFAMHDIREGFTERWYPFYNPPEIGVFVSYDNTRRGRIRKVSNVHVDGDIEYMHFNAKKGKPREFCGPANYHQRKMESWQESLRRTIMHGTNTLLNGMDERSLKEFSKNGVLGEGYMNKLSKREWIPEEKVEEDNLLKTNMHPICPAYMDKEL
ncbi:hypothetical protein ACFL6I_13760 [candidate division KSB1 bacterium]